MVYFTDHYNAISIDRVPSKTALIILFYVNPSAPSLQSRFRENSKILSKTSTTQENITISRQNLLFFIKNTKNPTLQQVTGEKIPNLVLKRMLEPFLKTPPLKKILEFQD